LLNNDAIIRKPLFIKIKIISSYKKAHNFGFNIALINHSRCGGAHRLLLINDYLFFFEFL